MSNQIAKILTSWEHKVQIKDVMCDFFTLSNNSKSNLKLALKSGSFHYHLAQSALISSWSIATSSEPLTGSCVAANRKQFRCFTISSINHRPRLHNKTVVCFRFELATLLICVCICVCLIKTKVQRLRFVSPLWRWASTDGFSRWLMLLILIGQTCQKQCKERHVRSQLYKRKRPRYAIKMHF